MNSVDATPQLYADLRNSGYTDREIARKIGISSSYLSKIVGLWTEQGVLLKYYNVLLDKLPDSIQICMYTLDQRISISSFLYSMHPLTIYFSPFPRPTYIVYRRSGRSSSKSLEAIDCPLSCEPSSKSLWRLVLSGVVEMAIAPLETYADPKIELLASSGQLSLDLDEYDQYIAEQFFKYFNPPAPLNYSARALANSISNLLKGYTYKNHYYRHLFNKVIKKRFIVRDISSLDYAVLVLYSSDLNSSLKILSSLYSKELLAGIDQVNFISLDPAIAVAHCWIDRDSVWTSDLVHSHFENSRYEIYQVRQIL